MQFTTDAIYEALKSPLGVVDNPERRQQLESYVEAARLPLERAVFDLLAQLAGAVNDSVSAHYEVTLGYKAGLLELDVRTREPAEAPDDPWTTTEGDVEKVTLRLHAELKDLAADAATKAGLSLNSWLVRVLARSVRSFDAPELPERGPRGRPRRHGHGGGSRLSGWVGPEE